MGCRHYSVVDRLEELVDEDGSRACVLRAPHRLTRPAFEAHPGANTFPSEVRSYHDKLHKPIRFPQHIFSVHDHGRQRSDKGPQHTFLPSRWPDCVQ